VCFSPTYTYILVRLIYIYLLSLSLTSLIHFTRVPQLCVHLHQTLQLLIELTYVRAYHVDLELLDGIPVPLVTRMVYTIPLIYQLYRIPHHLVNELRVHRNIELPQVFLTLRLAPVFDQLLHRSHLVGYVFDLIVYVTQELGHAHFQCLLNTVAATSSFGRFFLRASTLLGRLVWLLFIRLLMLFFG
jgi:hypothetical protein